MVLAIIMSYALQCFVPIDIIWNNYLLEKTKHLTNLQQQFIEFSIRTGCAILTCKYNYKWENYIKKLSIFPNFKKEETLEKP